MLRASAGPTDPTVPPWTAVACAAANRAEGRLGETAYRPLEDWQARIAGPTPPTPTEVLTALAQPDGSGLLALMGTVAPHTDASGGPRARWTIDAVLRQWIADGALGLAARDGALWTDLLESVARLLPDEAADALGGHALVPWIAAQPWAVLEGVLGRYPSRARLIARHATDLSPRALELLYGQFLSAPIDLAQNRTVQRTPALATHLTTLLAQRLDHAILLRHRFEFPEIDALHALWDAGVPVDLALLATWRAVAWPMIDAKQQAQQRLHPARYDEVLGEGFATMLCHPTVPRTPHETRWLVDVRAGVATAPYARFLRTASIGPERLLDGARHSMFSDAAALLIAVLQHPEHGQHPVVQRGVAEFLLHDHDMCVPYRCFAEVHPHLVATHWWTACAACVAAIAQMGVAEDRQHAAVHVHEVLAQMPRAMRATMPDDVRLQLLQAEASALRTWAILAGNAPGDATPAPPTRPVTAVR